MNVFEHGGHPSLEKRRTKILPKSQYHRDYNELVERCASDNFDFEHSGQLRSGEKNMTKTIALSMCLAASLLSLDAHAQGASAKDERQYTNGPVTEVDYIHVEYGGFAKYVNWLNSTWKPTMEALKKAGIIIDYKVFQSSPKSPDQPNVFLWLTFKNMAAYGGDIGDKVDEFDAVTDKVICNTECQNNARVARNEFRKVLGSELIREVILK